MPEKKTIMLYINSLGKGGAERVFVQLAERFARNGYRSVLVTSFVDETWEYPVSEQVERISIFRDRIGGSRIGRNRVLIKELRCLCKKFRPAVLVSCMEEPNFRAVLASRGLKIKTLVSVCNAPEKEYAGKLGFVVGKILMPMADGCVFQTPEEKAWFPERLQKKSRIICNQVSETFFDVHHTGERKNIVSVGRLNPQKNQAVMINAFSRIADRTDENLLIYGEGEMRESLQRQIDGLGLGERVKLMGQSGNIAEDIKGAKLFVMSSDYEGLPNALLEAMALGLPCISTDCAGGGPAMVIDSGVNGILYPIGDEAALAENMLRLLENEEAAAKLGQNARETAEKFRPEPIFAEWCGYVEKIISENGEPNG